MKMEQKRLNIFQHKIAQNDVIILDPDVKKYFPNSESVNATLRSLIKLIPQ